MSDVSRAAKLVSLLKQAITLHNGGDLDEADRIYRRVLQLDPRHPDALHLRALVGIARQHFAEAARLADTAIARSPRVANFHNTAGEAWRRQGRMDLARQRFDAALRLEPGLVLAVHNLSLVAAAEGKADEARALNRRALELDPAHFDALVHGAELAASEDDAALTEIVERGLARFSHRAEACRAFARLKAGLALRRLDTASVEEVASLAREAIAADPVYCGGWLLEAELALRRGDFAQAELHFALAANLAPRDSDARLNLAIVLERERRLDEAESHLQSFLREHPGHPTARFSLASIELMKGDHARGWLDYEARRELPGYRDPVPDLPPWRGGPVSRLLLYPEQGLGDSLQMLRFVPRARVQAGGTVVLQVQPALERLVRRLFADNAIEVVASAPELGCDAACSLMSLPLALGVTGDEELMPAEHYLAARPEDVARFSARLAALPGRKLGLVWMGSGASDINRLRTIGDDALAPLVNLAGWTTVSLQYGISNPRIGPRPLYDLAADIADFDDLASAMAAVDAIVTLDTGPAHLAGAMGLEAFVLLPRIHDWRWGAMGDACHWYASLQLCRQSAGGDWHAAVAGIAARLAGREPPPSRPELPAWRPVRRNRFPLVAAECRHGVIVFPLFDRYIARSLLAYGEYSPREADMLTAYLRPGDTAIDVGANLGALALPMARAVGAGGRILAFEPQRAVRACLEETLRLSGIDWIEARPQAVGNRNGLVSVPELDLAQSDNFGGVALNSGAPGEQVATIALDDLGLTRCRLIKIDVEGMELDVLQGAANLVATCHPVISVESDRPGSQALLERWLGERGYRLYSHLPPLFSPGNYRGNDVDLFPGLVSGNLLALPPGDVPPADAIPI